MKTKATTTNRTTMRRCMTNPLDGSPDDGAILLPQAPLFHDDGLRPVSGRSHRPTSNPRRGASRAPGTTGRRDGTRMHTRAFSAPFVRDEPLSVIDGEELQPSASA